MNLTVVLFAMLAAVTAASAVGVAASRSVVRAAVWLLFTLIGVAGVYFLLGAEFLGAAQLIVYVGGTMVLMVFGVMITNQGPFAVLRTRPVEWIAGGVLAGGLFVLLATASLNLVSPSNSTDDPLPGISPIGLSFLGVESGGKSYLLPFEVVSVHLLVVLVAAAYLARAKRRIPANPGRQAGGGSNHPAVDTAGSPATEAAP